MMYKWLTVLFFLILIMYFSTAQTSRAEIPPAAVNEGKGAIAGKVLDEYKQPLPDAVVSVFFKDSFITSEITDREGAFKTTDIPVSPMYAIEVKLHNYSTFRLENILLQSGRTLFRFFNLEKDSTNTSVVEMEYTSPPKKECPYASQDGKCPKCKNSKHVIPIAYGYMKTFLTATKKEKPFIDFWPGDNLFLDCLPNYYCKKHKLSF